MWKRFKHPNIVPFIGVTWDPLQFVSEWMPNGTLTQYLGKNPEADRICLVGLSCIGITSHLIKTFSKAIGHCRRSHISPCKLHNTWRSKRGGCRVSVVLNQADDLWSAKHPY